MSANSATPTTTGPGKSESALHVESAHQSRTSFTMAALRTLRNALKSFQLAPFISQIFRTTPHEPVVKASLHSLPNELLLEIFAFPELKPYIISHGICKKWRQLLPLTKLHPTRQRLLDLYHRILETPDFQKTLEWTNENLQEFDREEYIQSLLSQYPAIPEEFRMWILEWPPRLVIQCIWPGLSFTRCRMITPISRRVGVNWIAYRPFSPRLSSLVYKELTPAQTLIPCLLIWRHATEIDWLVFEQDEPDLFGRVFILDQLFHNLGTIPYYPRRPSIPKRDNNVRNDDVVEEEGSDSNDNDTESIMSEGEEYLRTWDDWICYLNYLWNRTSEELLGPSETYPNDDFLIVHPVFHKLNPSGPHVLPSPVWDPSPCSQSWNP